MGTESKRQVSGSNKARAEKRMVPQETYVFEIQLEEHSDDISVEYNWKELGMEEKGCNRSKKSEASRVVPSLR